MEQFNSDEVSYLDDKSIRATKNDSDFSDSDFEDDFETVSIFLWCFSNFCGREWIIFKMSYVTEEDGDWYISSRGKKW